MNNQKIPLTKEGYEKLKKEFDELKNIRRPEVVERMASARLQGDLAENSEYADAREELAYIDGRLEELEELLSGVWIIDDNHRSCGQVGLGCKVTVETGNGRLVFHLVGEWEANPVESKISHQSPLGQSLMGKKVGNRVEVDVPAGKLVYTIVKID